MSKLIIYLTQNLLIIMTQRNKSHRKYLIERFNKPSVQDYRRRHTTFLHHSYPWSPSNVLQLACFSFPSHLDASASAAATSSVAAVAAAETDFEDLIHRSARIRT